MTKSNNKHVEISISSRTLKSCVQHGGNLVLNIDLDVTQVEHFPTGDEEVFMKSKKNVFPENYTDKGICLVANQRIVFVDGQSYWLRKRPLDAITILYNQFGHMLDYIEFAKQYHSLDSDTKLSPKEAGKTANSVVKYVNNYFIEKHIPLILKRYEGLIILEQVEEEN